MTTFFRIGVLGAKARKPSIWWNENVSSESVVGER